MKNKTNLQKFIERFLSKLFLWEDKRFPTKAGMYHRPKIKEEYIDEELKRVVEKNK